MDNDNKPDRKRDILAEDLRRLTEEDLRGVLGNAVLVALHHREEATARSLLYQIRAHLSSGGHGNG